MSGGVAASGGALFTAVFHTQNNSIGASFTIQGFGLGVSKKDISFSVVPNIGARLSIGLSIPLPIGFTNQPDPRPPGG